LEALLASVAPAVVGPLFLYLLDVDYSNYIFPIVGSSYIISGMIAACFYPRKVAESPDTMVTTDGEKNKVDTIQ
jgi:hypothetical protein